MKKIILDIECTTTELSDKYKDYSPYNPLNKLVSIGWRVDNRVEYLFFNHQELQGIDENQYNKLKHDLASAQVMVAHNAKFDFQWLAEAGFKVDHLELSDTMIREYVMSRGAHTSLKLVDLANKYDVSAKKTELIEEYYAKGIQMDAIPMHVVQEYGEADVVSCWELHEAQEARLSQPSYEGLKPTVDMMNEFCRVLSEMERAGVRIDRTALDLVKEEFTNEADELKRELTLMVRSVLGDTPINFESPQQLSQVIYSRRVKPGREQEWVETFNIGKDDRGKLLKRPKMSYRQFGQRVQELSDVVLKTEVERCPDCSGRGFVPKFTTKGVAYKRNPKCKTCTGEGIIFKDLNEIAGFKMKPTHINFTTISGFSTSQIFLEELIEQAVGKNKENARLFLQKIMRLNSVSSYLSNFVGGISAFLQASTGILHPNFNQCITATGRLSSTKPNLQNQPREATFPIRKVFVSRWADIGGELGEVDFRQLEFRVAVHLAEDKTGREHILNDVDIHNQTARVITEAGQATNRQDAKPHTFKPLYGGRTGTDAERAYYKAFLEIYSGISDWHYVLQEEAIRTKMVTLPTGRQFIFPDVERSYYGGATRYTQIVNYPVQGFATGDIVPIAIIRLFREMKRRNLRSLIVLTVHDSIVVDIYPGERDIVLELLAGIGRFAEEELARRYSIEMYVPLTCEVKYGTNLLRLRKVA